MSRSADPGRTGVRDDGGFTLVEIIVALGVLMVVLVSLLPQLVVGIRSTGTARLVTQAKGVAQGQLEKMRNLPFHVSPAAGDYRDVLDYYYRKKEASSPSPTCMVGSAFAQPTSSWTGYVSAAATRCSYEPTGAFYRKVEEVAPTAGMSGFTVVVDTQFLSGATPPLPVTPPDGYDTQTTSKDSPASSQIGITVTVFYRDRATLRPVSSFTQIADKPTSTTRVKAEADVTALAVGSVSPSNGPVSLSAGLVNLTGSLTYASTANANLAATSAGLATGEQASGASRSLAAPPSTTATTAIGTAGQLATYGCDFACWGSTRLDVSAIGSDGGLPTAGSATSPMQSLLTDTANNGVSFSNGPVSTYRPALDLSGPLVRVDPSATANASGIASGCAPGSTGTSSFVTGSGFVRTTSDTDAVDPYAVEACSVARTTSISLFPTAFAPRGVVRVELSRASTRCQVRTASHTPTATFDYAAVVSYWNGTGYQSAGTIDPTIVSDPLEGIDLATTSVGGTRFLGDYIASWSALTAAEVTKTESGGVAEVALPGVVTISTTQVRPAATDPDGASVVSMAVGAVSCTAQDAR